MPLPVGQVAVRTVRVTCDGHPMRVYVASPTVPAAGSVVVLHETFGVTEHLRDVARRLAAEGHEAVVPHLFHRTGDPELPYDDPDGVAPHVGALTADLVRCDIDAVLDLVATLGHSPASVALVGFGLGGTLALQLAIDRALACAVTFYGGGLALDAHGFGTPLARMGGLRTPWLGLYGDADALVPTADVDALARALPRTGIDAELRRYPGVGHAFHNDARPDRFDESAAVDAWGSTLGFLAAHLTPAAARLSS